MSAALQIVPSERRIFKVTVDNVMSLWPHWEPLLARALRGIETHDPLDVRRAVLGEQAQLWAQWSGVLEAFIVSEFVHYPKGIWLRLWLAAAADGHDLQSDQFEDMLAEWRDANDCRGFEIVGRMGWLRRFPEARMAGVVLRTVT